MKNKLHDIIGVLGNKKFHGLTFFFIQVIGVIYKNSLFLPLHLSILKIRYNYFLWTR